MPARRMLAPTKRATMVVLVWTGNVNVYLAIAAPIAKITICAITLFVITMALALTVSVNALQAMEAVTVLPF